jgi:dTDP-glucose 4,6-dehydratase
MKRNIMITGAAGFIGSHVLGTFLKNHPDYNILVVDILTYAASLENMVESADGNSFSFVQEDIRDFHAMLKLMRKWKIDGIVHLAAESHVDNSIKEPFKFADTNIMGTLSLLQAAKVYWGDECPDGYEGKLFYHVSTDEVFGALGPKDPPFTEKTPYNPHSPYSASKAASDHFVRAYHDTYGLPIIISNCSNNFGPHQHHEKLIPMVISKIKKHEKIPVYGNGENVRDWLFVIDHANAIDLLFHHGEIGESYNIGGKKEMSNIAIIKKIIEFADRQLGNPEGYSLDLIEFVTDRPGHDFRYGIDNSKIFNSNIWVPLYNFDYALDLTVKYYLEHENN